MVRERVGSQRLWPVVRTVGSKNCLVSNWEARPYLQARKREDAAASGLLTFECSQIIQNLSLDLPDMLGRRAIREIASELATALKTLLKYPPVPFAFHSGISLYRASKRVLARYCAGHRQWLSRPRPREY